MASGTEDTSGGASTRRCRVNSHAHSHSHGRSWVHRSNSEPVVDSTDSNQEFAEPSTGSVSELRYLYHWLQKSLPFLILLCSKLVIQHAAGEYEMDCPGFLNIPEQVIITSAHGVCFQVCLLGSASLQAFCMSTKISRLKSFCRYVRNNRNTTYVFCFYPRFKQRMSQKCLKKKVCVCKLKNMLFLITGNIFKFEQLE